MDLLSQGMVRLSYALLQNNKVHNHGRSPPSSLPQSWPDWWLWLVMTAYYQWPGKGRCRNTTTFLHYAATWVQYLSGRSFWLEIKRSRVQIPAGSRIFFQDNVSLFASLVLCHQICNSNQPYHPHNKKSSNYHWNQASSISTHTIILLQRPTVTSVSSKKAHKPGERSSCCAVGQMWAIWAWSGSSCIRNYSTDQWKGKTAVAADLRSIRVQSTVDYLHIHGCYGGDLCPCTPSEARRWQR